MLVNKHGMEISSARGFIRKLARRERRTTSEPRVSIYANIELVAKVR